MNYDEYYAYVNQVAKTALCGECQKQINYTQASKWNFRKNIFTGFHPEKLNQQIIDS